MKIWRASGPDTDRAPLPATLSARGARPLQAAPLVGDVTVDVAIVGGGFTGLSAALRLLDLGRSVAVLEAKEVGGGGSGRAFGQVVPYTRHAEAGVLRRLGPVWGPRMLEAAGKAPDTVFGLIAHHGIACDPVRTGLIFAAYCKDAVQGLERRSEFWRARGAEVATVCGPELHGMVGSSFYDCALFDRRGGSINPLAFARGLGAAVRRGGGLLFESTPVLGLLPRGGGGWTLSTPMGSVRCRHSLLATDAYTDKLWPDLRCRLLPIRAYQFVSAPLADDLRPRILPGGQALTDTRRLYSGVRLRPDGRLQVSVPGPPFDDAGSPRTIHADRRVTELFPWAGKLVWEEAVSGWVGMSGDQFPHVQTLGPALHAAVGLSGRGIGLGVMLGQDIARRLAEAGEEACLFSKAPLPQMPPEILTRMCVGALLKGKEVLDTFDRI